MPSFPNLSEQFNFSTDLSADANWDTNHNATNDLACDGDDVKPPAEDNKTFAGIHQTAAGSITQCVAFELKSLHSNGGTFGAVFRAASAAGTGAQYVSTLRWSGSVWQFSCERFIGTSHQETIGTPIDVTTPNSLDWFGFAVTGTGTGTVFDYWDFGASDPGEFSTWNSHTGGSPTQTQTANPSTALDSGDYVGLWFYTSNTPARRHEIDTWYGGDQAAGGGVTVPVLDCGKLLGGFGQLSGGLG